MFTILWTGINNSTIQTILVKKILNKISENIGAEISIGKIETSFIKNITINEILIKDKEKDTLLYISKIDANIKNISLSDKKVSINNLVVEYLYGNVYQINDTTLNLSFIIDELNKSNKKSFDWNIYCKEFTIKNSLTALNIYSTPNIIIDRQSLMLSDIIIDSIQQKLNINYFTNYLNNKRFLTNISGEIDKKGDIIKCKGFNINTKNTDLNIIYASLKIPKKTEGNLFSFKANVADSKIILSDFYKLMPFLENKKDTISLKGDFTIKNNIIKGNKVYVQINSATKISSDFFIRNYNKITDLYYYLDINNLVTNKNDITYILKNYINVNTTNINSQLNLLDTLSYEGKITGNYYNLKNNGILLSKIGQLETDLVLYQDSINNKIIIDGNLKALPIYLGADTDINSEIYFDINANGSYSKQDGPDIDIKGSVGHILYNTKTIDSISIDGNINKDKFSGKISSFDTKLRFDFNGILNFDKVNSYNFILDLYNADLYKLGLTKKTKANLSLTVNANFSGNNIDNTIGKVKMLNVYYMNDTSYLSTDSIVMTSIYNNSVKEFKLKSQYINGKILGKYNMNTLINSFKQIVHFYLPALNFQHNNAEYNNNFSFEFIANHTKPLTDIFSSSLKIADSTKITGGFNDSTNNILLRCKSNQIRFNSRILDSVDFKIFNRRDNLSLIATVKGFQYSDNNVLKNFNITSNVHNDSIKTNLNWNNRMKEKYNGNINTLLTISNNNKKQYLKLDIFPSNIVVLDTLWFLSDGYIKKDSTGFILNNLNIYNDNSRLELFGVVSDNPRDSIVLNVENIDMNNLNKILQNKHLIFGGLVTGKTIIRDIKHKKQINSDLYVNKLSLNKEIIGDTKIQIKWNNLNQKLLVRGKSIKDSVNNFSFNGDISLEEKTINIDTKFTQQDLKTIEPFLTPTFNNVSGLLNGEITVYGELQSPSWKGSLKVSDAKLCVTETKVYYDINDYVFFDKHDIIFKNISVFDKEKNKAVLNGTITNENFSLFTYNIKLETDKILAIDLKSGDNAYYYGKIYGEGYVEIVGPDNLIDINIVAKTKNYSYIQVPLEDKSDIEENNFIEFVKHTKEKAKTIDKKNEELIINKSITNLRIDLEVTPDMEVQIMFDPRIGDMLRANGFAHLTIESLGPDFNMYGDYSIIKGDFTFTLQNIINKRLNIQQGSTVSWTGAPLDASINIDAVYKVRKASVFDLTQDENDKEKRVDVNTHLLMTGKLTKPNIKFAVDVPSATNDEAIDQLNSLPEEDLNKQVISLLLINKFTPLTTFQTNITNNATATLGTTTASEFLSAQLSSWMSQISNDFDLGFVYRPGDQTSQQEIEVALSTNILNDRVILNGNFGYSENMRKQTNTPLTGDGSIEYKLNKKGNVRLRAFQKVNNDITYTQAPYTQGIGVFYTEEFDNFDELMQKIFRKDVATKPKEINIEEDKEESSSNNF